MLLCEISTMTHLNIEKISLSCRDREKEEQKRNLRKKSMLVLIHHYLKDNGFIDTADVLRSESRFSIDEYTVCDNIHLESILQDFESYHFLKYQKIPVITKKIPSTELRLDSLGKNYIQKSKKQSETSNIHRKITSEISGIEKNISMMKNINNCEIKLNNNLGDCDVQFSEPLGAFNNYSTDWKSMANIIMQDFSKCDKSVNWSEIIGHERVKQLLKEALVYPLKYSDFFSATSMTWKSILLYGPSGTGKTLLASAAASECKANLFKICVSTIVSKWRGESEKLIRVLFDLAKHYAPSIIFIDEIDALISQRGNDHEASRRMKTEFFLQMDALTSCNKYVVLLGATNMPWELDHALLRRMEKRILVALPDAESRICVFKKFLSSNPDMTHNAASKIDINYDELAKVSDGYSASDIQLVCKEAKMSCMRRAIDYLENYRNGTILQQTTPFDCLKMSDVLIALSITKPAATQLIEKYEEWKEKQGAE